MSCRYRLGCHFCFFHLTHVIFLLLVLAIVHPMILPEQENFLEMVLAIPFAERSWKRLVTLDTLHAFCGGPIPSEEAP